MDFYDKDGKTYTFNITEDDYFDQGTQAKIYKINDKECLKVMNSYHSNYFNEELFNELKSLSLKGLVKLGVPFYIDGKIKAYTMDYLEKSTKSILDMPTEYTLDNLNSLYKDILILAKNLIMAIDLYHRNIIIGDSKMTIIDFDVYKKLSFDNNILWHNTNNLLYAFKRHYAASLKSSGIDFNTKKIGNMTVDDYLGYLFDYTGYKEEPSLVLERKLIGTRTPRELFDRKW